MIRRENPNFKASLYAPNPKEVTYWIDLKEGPDGQIIKTFNGIEWVMVNDALNDKQNEEIEDLKDRCTNLEETKIDKTEFNEFATTVATQIGQKQDTLVSGTNIKTINNESVLGSGNITLVTNSQLTEGLAAKLDVTTYTADKATFALKTEIPDVTSKVTGTGITKIEVVETSPSAQEDGVMYLVTSTKEIWIGTVKLYPNA